MLRGAARRRCRRRTTRCGRSRISSSRSPRAPPPGAAAKANTAVPLERLRELNASLLALPTDFSIHRKLERGREQRVRHARRRRRADDRLGDGRGAGARVDPRATACSIRLTGEDVERGTFSHRHAVLHDVDDRPRARAAAGAAAGARRVRDPQQPADRERGARLRVRLQRAGAVAAGHLGSAVRRLHQRRAGRCIDEFVVSARGKWGQRPSLVLLLPHAHEGQGPDHASARPERFLQLAADINMRVANCTTAAQYFHLLRRQAALLLVDPLPLIVLTPKSLLRHPLVASAPRELAEGRFRMVIDDHEAETRARRHPPRDRLQRQDLRRPDGAPSSARRAPDVADLPARAALSGADARPARGDRRLSRSRRGRLGPGRAREHGRVGVRAAAPRRRSSDGRTVRRVARPRSASPAEGSARAARASSAGAHRAGVRRASRVARSARRRRRTAPQPALTTFYAVKHRRARSRRVDRRRARREVAAQGRRRRRRRRSARRARDRQDRRRGQRAAGRRA